MATARGKTPCLIGGLEIDVATVEEHEFTMEVTDHPVESGANVTDHARPEPIMVTIEGVVSDSPIGTLKERRNNTGTAGQFLPSEYAYAFLIDMFNAREPITIETTLRTFERMMIQSLSFPKTPQTGDALQFRATFKEVNLITNDRATIPVAKPNGNKKIALGNKGAMEVVSGAASGATAGVTPLTESRKVRRSNALKAFKRFTQGDDSSLNNFNGLGDLF